MKKVLILTFVLATCQSGLAAAATIDYTGVGKTTIVTIGGLYSGSVYAGELNWAWIGTPPAGFAPSFYAYCVDVLHDATDPESVAVKPIGDLTPATSPKTVAGAAGTVAWLVDTYAPAIHQSGTGAQAAGLQIAIWEALYDMQGGTFNLDAGQFKIVTSGTTERGWATTYLTAAATANASSYKSSDAWLDSTGGQDQIVRQVPEPASLSLLIVGVAVTLASSRRIRRRSHPVA